MNIGFLRTVSRNCFLTLQPHFLNLNLKIQASVLAILLFSPTWLTKFYVKQFKASAELSTKEAIINSIIISTATKLIEKLDFIADLYEAIDFKLLGVLS